MKKESEKPESTPKFKRDEFDKIVQKLARGPGRVKMKDAGKRKKPPKD